MKTYEKYKDSGVQWIGQIPSHWDITPLKYLCSMSDKKNDDGVERRMLSVSQYHGIIEKTYDSDVQVRDGEESTSYWVVEDNDLVINTMWLNYRGLGVSFGKRGFVSPGYRVYHLNLTFLNPKFIHYLMRSDDYVLTYTRLLRGIRPNSLQVSTYDFQHIDLYVPPLPEQHQIVSFLDEKTSLIDDLINKKEQKIGLLKEYRTSLINRVITKGLNPDCPMKDSGVEWIGEIPSNWEVKRSKWLFTQRNLRGFTDEPLLSVTQDKSLIRRDENDIRVWNPTSDISGYKLVVEGDFVISLRSFEGGIEFSKVRGIVSPAYSVFDSISNENDDFLRLLFKTNDFINELNTLTTGIRQGKNIGYDDFSSVSLPLPPLPEQEQIVSFLDEKTGEIDRTIQSEQKKIELLKEYRQSLISSVITGKIKVVN